MAANKTAIEKANVLFRNSYNSIGGVDIKAVIAGATFGNLQAISYSITREKAPVHTMGSPEPRGFARGKRGIAGSLVMVMFDDHALISAIHKIQGEDYKFVTDKDELRPLAIDMDTKESSITPSASQYELNVGSTRRDGSNYLSAFNTEGTLGDTLEESWERTSVWYADQIPSFNIVLTGVNEEGFAATMSILGVEILNEGYGISIDDLVSEQQMTYVCRAIARWRPLHSDTLTNKQKRSPLSSVRGVAPSNTP